MSLGERFYAWLVKVAAAIVNSSWYKPFNDIVTRLNKIINPHSGDFTQDLIDKLFFIPEPFSQVTALTLAAWTGRSLPGVPAEKVAQLKTLYTDPAKFFIDQIQSIATLPGTEQVANRIMELIINQIIIPLEQDVASGNATPAQTMAKIGRVIAAFTGAGNAVGFAGEVLGLGQIEGLQVGIQDLIRQTGMNTIMQNLMYPLITVGFHNSSERYYNRMFRPRRWSAGELMNLSALRAISDGDFNSRMADLGYRDEDIALALRLAEQKVSAGDVLAALDLHMIDLGEAVRRLHAKGYATEDIDFLLRLQTSKEQQDNYNSIASVALTAYKKGVISEARYREIRAAARIPRERIDLELQIADLAIKSDLTDLKVGNIKDAYFANVLSTQEVSHYLTELGVDSNAQNILIATWNEQKAPKVLRLNAATILRAMSDGVLDYGQTLDKLKGLGWTVDDAKLMIDVENRNRVVAPRVPSNATIVSALANGLIDEQTAITRLEASGLSHDDAVLNVQLGTIHPKRATKNLSDSDIVKLFEVGVFQLSDAIGYLITNGYDEQTATLLMIARTTPKASKAVQTEVQPNVTQ